MNRPTHIKLNMQVLDELDGNFPAAIVYSQIAYWHGMDEKGQPRLKAERGGKLWLVRQQEQLAEECRISYDQTRRALDLLKRLKYIGWETHFSPYHGGKRALWVTLLPRESNCAPMHNSNSAAVPGTISSIMGEDYNPKTLAPEAQMKLKDVLQAQSGKQPVGLPALWKNRLGLKNEKFVKPLTNKEMGQLKKVGAIITSAGEEPPMVVEWVIAQWTNFVRAVQVADGVGPGPVDPHIGFLLAHADVAVNAFRDSQKAPPPGFVSPITDTSSDKVGQQVQPAAVNIEAPASPEEIAKALQSVEQSQ